MTQLGKLLDVVGSLSGLIPDEEKRETFEQQLQAAKDDYPYPEKDNVAGAVTQAKVDRLKTAIDLLGKISAETKAADAEKVIKQVLMVLKAFTAEGFAKPSSDIEYPGSVDNKPKQLDESWKGKASASRIQGRLLEAVAGTKNRFKICIAESGTGKNGNVYPLDVLRRRASDYNDRPMYLDHKLREVDGVPSLEGDVSTVIEAHVDEHFACSNGSVGALLGVAVIHNQEWLKEVQVPEFRRRLGISHIVQAKTHEEASNSQMLQIVEDLIPERVDWVSQEAQGGRVLESHNRQGVKMTDHSVVDEGLKREVRRLRAKDEAREMLMLSESLDPQTRNEIVQEVADIAEKTDEPIDVKTITEAIQKRYEGAIDRASKTTSPIMPGAAGRSASGSGDVVQKAADALGGALFGQDEKA